jgi:glucosamine--fructose-6-phosphate aminotransferase (isomerizing)
MCGIIGYTGFRPAQVVLIEGLKRLEYRGYDSAGVVIDDGGRLKSVKCKGMVEDLREKLRHSPWAEHAESATRAGLPTAPRPTERPSAWDKARHACT